MNKNIVKISVFMAIYSVLVVSTVMVASSSLKEIFYGLSLERVTGKVITSEVQAELVRTGFPPELTTRYKARIGYIYDVEGETLLGNKMTFSDEHYDTELDAKNALRKFRVGKTVSVFYSPLNPEDAVLLKTFSKKNLALSSLLAIASVFMTLLGISSYLKSWVASKEVINKDAGKQPTQEETTEEIKPKSKAIPMQFNEGEDLNSAEPPKAATPPKPKSKPVPMQFNEDDIKTEQKKNPETVKGSSTSLPDEPMPPGFVRNSENKEKR